MSSVSVDDFSGVTISEIKEMFIDTGVDSILPGETNKIVNKLSSDGFIVWVLNANNDILVFAAEKE